MAGAGAEELLRRLIPELEEFVTAVASRAAREFGSLDRIREVRKASRSQEESISIPARSRI